MGRRTKKYRTTAVTAILAISVFCYWLMVNPQLLLFREGLQLFLCNSRWILFTSRRDDGLYTRLYLAHIDQQGRAGKPFMLPQRHPKDYYRRLMYSCNTPDFTVRPVHLQTLRLQHDIEDAVRIKTQTLSCNDHVWTTPQVCVVKIN